MPMKPHKGESQSDFLARCVPEMIGTGEDKRPREQAVAICMDIWRNKDKQIDPEDYDDEDEFISDCVDELGNEDVCQTIWDNRAVSGIKHKTSIKAHDSKLNGMEFVLSDETPDRMDDVIMSDGWQLDEFKKNPIALFGHKSDFPIGKWKNIKVVDKQLRGQLEFAPAGTSARLDEIRALVDADILRAVSVGFKPLESRPRKESDWGSFYTKAELVECSLVAVPANPNALAVAKSLKISRETMDLIFGGQANRDQMQRREFNGGKAKTSRNGKVTAMEGLATRITGLEAAINSKREELDAHLAQMDDSNVSDADLEKNNRLNSDILQLEKTRASLVDSEKLLAVKTAGSENGSRTGRAVSTVIVSGERERVTAPSVIVNRTKDNMTLIDYLVRGAVVTYIAKATGKSPEETRLRIYGDDDGTKAIVEIVTRAASAPAMTTVTGWAQELAQTTYAALMPLLMPKAILTRLAPKGLTLDFGTAGRIVIPTRSRTPSLAGSFVGEGMPIPVRQGAFTSQTLTPKKMAVISTWTREMGDHSVPAIEGLIREAIQQDTTVAIDTVLLDANAATTIRPAGLLNGVGATAATAGGGLAALVGDITNLINAISTNTLGNTRNLVWLANQTDMLRASLLSAANTGIFPFAAQIAAGNLNGIPIIDSATVTAKTLILVDAADFVVVGGDAPRMEMSDQATLHMEDTTPLDLVASPSTVAAPQRSLFQTDSLALRMVMPLNWLQRRTGTVAWTQNVTW